MAGERNPNPVFVPLYSRVRVSDVRLRRAPSSQIKMCLMQVPYLWNGDCLAKFLMVFFDEDFRNINSRLVRWVKLVIGSFAGASVLATFLAAFMFWLALRDLVA